MKLKNLHDFETLIKDNGIQDISKNSNNISENSIFVAIKGFTVDGNNFIEDAFSKGAKIALTDDEDCYKKLSSNNKIFLCENAKKAAALISTILFEDAPDNLIAITGTNGKSSIVHYIYSLAKLLGTNSARIGTMGAQYNIAKKETNIATVLTTPEAIEFNKILSKLKSENINICALEASSIGIVEYRIYGRKYDVCAFTNFSVDHLDFHENIENYLDAKLQLFSDHMHSNSIALINSDMDKIEEVKSFLQKHNRKFYTIGKKGDISFEIKLIENSYRDVEVIFENQKYNFKTNIIGDFQIYNILFAAFSLNQIGFSLDEIFPHIINLSAPNGRLERVEERGKGSNIYIDFAHTPDALENILIELSKVKKKDTNLITLFGCGGDRDNSKRKIMGSIADKYADIVIVTDDNPRCEDPAKIREEVASDIKNPIIIDGRRNAILKAINIMNENDILVIAGKGHEDYQIIGKDKIKFSDIETVREIINENGGR